MRVLLISSNTAVSPYPVYPLGCSIVAAALEQGGHEVRQLDYLTSATSLDLIKSELQDYNPELVGISIRNIDTVNILCEIDYIEAVKDIICTIREASTVKIVLGGAGYSLMPETLLDEIGADFGIVGEGEVLLVEFVNNLEMGRYPSERIIRSQKLLAGGSIPSPSYDESIMRYYCSYGKIAPVQTKRGCPNKCVYCTYPILEGSGLRVRDVQNVVSDIEHLINEHDVKFIFLTDSVFNDRQGRYLDFVDEIIRRKLTVSWSAFFTPQGLDDGNVAKMRESGLVSAEIGVDAATDTTLKGMGKGFSFSEVEYANQLFSRHGVCPVNFYIFGGPGETCETVEEGIKNILRMEKSIHCIFMGIRILPNTPLEKIALDENLISPDNNLLKPSYYISPDVDASWMNDRLTGAFAKRRNCIYPPEAADDKLKVMHKMGYAGPLWELLIGSNYNRKRGKNRHE